MIKIKKENKSQRIHKKKNNFNSQKGLTNFDDIQGHLNQKVGSYNK